MLIFSLIDQRMQLNNYLQRRFRSTRDVQLVESATGPAHAQWWTVVVFFRHIEYGRGVGLTKSSATELACQMALQALMQPGAGH
ncbi:hypothetical protein K503DRAFT_682892 [Rhizopogon vinicolor AM-OR11-026]|uniref:DRBM domain-containing protein n=1 Tax=Rhizopogon vinicolor AM-OR11-026 TaxID=1314800 RepID=A0A1B7NCT2_9AGAM|nr:hypothetical protein K503DRAFT_682892 [Rhizopogon vinicolor AM-OR11-026]